MNTSENNKPYLEHIRTLQEKDLNIFLKEFSILADRNYKDYKAKFDYLKNCYSPLLFDILKTDDFLKCYYLNSQANYIKDKLKIAETDISILNTLVYCYNTNARDFIKAQELKDFESKMEQEGYIKISPEQKELNGKKVLCYTDILKYSPLDSNYKKELVEGKLLYSDYNKSLMILPKGHSKSGLIIRNAYIKEIK